VTYLILPLIVIALTACSVTLPDTEESHINLGEQARSLMHRLDRLTYERQLNIQEQHELSERYRKELQRIVSDLNANLLSDNDKLPEDFWKMVQDLESSVLQPADSQVSLDKVQAVCANCHKRYRKLP